MQYFHQYAKHGFVVTIEDNTLVGGLGTEIKELIAEKQLSNVTVKTFGYPDVFVEHGISSCRASIFLPSSYFPTKFLNVQFLTTSPSTAASSI